MTRRITLGDDAVPPEPVPEWETLPLRLAILDRGFVYVGRIKETPEGIRIERAACVRRWGTTNGLGQLAAEGPTRQTILEESLPVIVYRAAVMHQIECDAGKWPASR